MGLLNNLQVGAAADQGQDCGGPAADQDRPGRLLPALQLPAQGSNSIDIFFMQFFIRIFGAISGQVFELTVWTLQQLHIFQESFWGHFWGHFKVY